MTNKSKQKILNWIIASVWLINGLFCKVLNFVPRHQAIVANILGSSHSRLLTIIIGILETAMAVWIVSGLWAKFNAIMQIVVIATMNTLEFILVPNLLLWGKANAFFAFLFILLICYNEFYLHKNTALQA